MAWLYNALGTLLSWFSTAMGGSYALALVLYALVFKILFLPFSIKQQKNQIAMAKLTPKIAVIRAKYKGRNDQATMQKQTKSRFLRLKRMATFSHIGLTKTAKITAKRGEIIVYEYTLTVVDSGYIARGQVSLY